MIISSPSCEVPSNGSRFQRRNIRRERDHVVLREFFNDQCHRLGSASLPRMLLEIVQLTYDIARRTTGNPGDQTQALKALAMTARAGNRGPRSPGFGERFALRDTSSRHIGHKL